MLPSEMSDPLFLGRTWRAILGRMEIDPSPGDSYALRGARILRIDGGTALIEARSTRNCEWLTERLAAPISTALAAILGESFQIEFVPPQGDAPVEALWGAASNACPAPGAMQGLVNCAFTLERYLTGQSNRIAFQACTALLNGSLVGISPVVVWGAPGLGKTHLLHAIASAAAAAGKRVACLNAEHFTTGYQTALRNKDVRSFQDQLRTSELFILDDLQYLEGKAGTLTELGFTIEAVTNAGGQVVIASERHPLQLALPERLKSRLTAGVVARVNAFSRDERQRFVDIALAGLGVRLPGFAVDRIVGLEAGSVRSVQGAVHAAVALQAAELLYLERLDAELVGFAAHEACVTVMDPLALLGAIATHFNTTTEHIVGRSRTPVLTRARATAASALRTHGKSLAEVSHILGGRDRSTVRELAQRGRELLVDEPELLARLAL